MNIIDKLKTFEGRVWSEVEAEFRSLTTAVVSVFHKDVAAVETDATKAEVVAVTVESGVVIGVTHQL